jgi:protein PhnA
MARQMPQETDMAVKDSNGAARNEGDPVQITKDLKVKGSSTTLNRGALFKNIHLTDDKGEIERWSA